MSNLSENKINLVLSAADVATITTSIQTITSKIPANITLTNEQRLSYNAINVANKIFVEDCLVVATQNGAGIMPAFVNLTNLQNDLNVFNQLDQIESSLNNLLQKIADAKRIAGHEAFAQANVVYKAFKMANENGIPNAKAPYDRLKARYEVQGVGKNSSTQV